MKIFAIRDDNDLNCKDLAYLLYYETEKRFYIELPDNVDPWETPLLLSSFAKRGETTVNSYWSKIWVQQRIVPTDRQNINQILKDNGLKKYDEYDLLMLSQGRCAQDDYYLTPITQSDLSEDIISRFEKKIEDIVTLENYRLLVFFRDGSIRLCNLKTYFENDLKFKILLNRPEYFKSAKMETGGYGISWDVNLTIPDNILYSTGQEVPLSISDFHGFVKQRVINAAEAAEILNCSRQNINDLIKRDKLHPIKASGKDTLFLKSEILKRNWQ